MNEQAARPPHGAVNGGRNSVSFGERRIQYMPDADRMQIQLCAKLSRKIIIDGSARPGLWMFPESVATTPSPTLFRRGAMTRGRAVLRFIHVSRILHGVQVINGMPNGAEPAPLKRRLFDGRRCTFSFRFRSTPPVSRSHGATFESVGFVRGISSHTPQED